MRHTVGRAKLFIHYHPIPSGLFHRTLGWRPWLLTKWAEPAVSLCRKIQPDMIRCHGNSLNGILAVRIKAALGIPYVVSLHINPDEDIRRRCNSWKEFIIQNAVRSVEKIVLENSDLVLPVYKSIVSYLKRMNIRQYEVAYNIINPSYLRKKETYALHSPVRIVNVGRQFNERNPENIMLAVKELSGVHLTLIGNGPIHSDLQNLALKHDVQNKVTFISSLSNDKLCQQLHEYDIFAVHSEYWELNKSVLEALLTGLPVVTNRRQGEPVPEFEGSFIHLVDNTVDGYHQILKKLIEDDQYREQVGRQAYAHAQMHWSPEKTEAHIVDIYRRVMNRAA